MPDRVVVAIVGCGVFGAKIALVARSLGLSVTVFEEKRDILLGASAHNQNRLHLDFHYPRDLNTARPSIRGFDAFKSRYAACIRGGFPHACFIAENGSLTTAAAYLEFCDLLGVLYEPISADRLDWDVRGVSAGILCDEVVYDCAILRELVQERLQRDCVDVVLGERVERITRSGAGYRIDSAARGSLDAGFVINASWGRVPSHGAVRSPDCRETVRIYGRPHREARAAACRHHDHGQPVHDRVAVRQDGRLPFV
jgi:glycine/D-amino acid oxidase-like deaminating enzyme